MYKIYQVGLNDTIDSIAQKFNTTVENIKKLNGIKDGMTLMSGGFLIVPQATEKNEYKTYLVKKGDTIYSIAKENNIDYETLLQLNGLDESDYIYPNQEISIPMNRLYITKENETIESIAKKLGVPVNQIRASKGEIYLAQDQLLTY